MTEEQEHKARMALLQARLDNLFKTAALELRKECIESVSFFGLPYRLLYDLKNKHLQPEDEAQLAPMGQNGLNRFYPQPGASKDCIKRIAERVREASPNNDENAYFYSKIKLTVYDEKQERLKKIAEAVEAEEFEKEYTPPDKKAYYFTPFLKYADLDSYKNYEWTGEPIPEAEAERLKAEYKARMADYEAHPDKYSPKILKPEESEVKEDEKQV